MHKSLLLALLIGNVTLRLFTNYLNVLPRIFNIADLFIVALLIVSFILGAKDPAPLKRGFGSIVVWLLVFNVLPIIGTVLNSHYIYSLSAISQLLMWNEPIVLFLLLVYARFSVEDVYQFVRVLVVLIKIELVVGFLQIYNFLSTGASEEIKGTFYHNAEQYQAFVLIGVFYLIGKLEISDDPRKKTLYKMAIAGILVLVMLIDNKASWVTTALTLFYLLMRMPALSLQVQSKMKYVWAFVGIVGLGYIVVSASSTSLEKYGRLSEAWDTGNISNLGKIKAYDDVLDAYASHPHMVLFGAGLGTFYSRAAWQFMPPKITEIYAEAPAPTQEQVYSESNSMGGVITPVTSIEPFYRQFYRDKKIFPLFSGTADQPNSTYVSLLGETGILSTFLYIAIYWTVLKRFRKLIPQVSQDARIFPFAVATTGFLFYLMLMGTYNFWLEDARLATILWSMIAMVLKYAELKGIQVPEKVTEAVGPMRMSPVITS